MKMLNAGLIILVFLINGCTSRSSEEDRLRIIIARYNNAMIDAYRNAYYEPLKDVATEEEVRRIDIIVTSYMQGNLIMEMELHRIDFKDIKIEKVTATINTSENWSYKWMNFKNGKEVVPLKDIQYEMSYSLIKKDEKWFVDRTKEIKGKGSAQHEDMINAK